MWPQFYEFYGIYFTDMLHIISHVTETPGNIMLQLKIIIIEYVYSLQRQTF